MASTKKDLHISLSERTYELIKRMKDEKGISFSAIISLLIQEAAKNEQYS